MKYTWAKFQREKNQSHAAHPFLLPFNIDSHNNFQQNSEIGD